MDAQPVSVVIPARNAETNISACLESIRNARYPQDMLEVIVVDDGSSDGTVERAREFDAKIVHSRRRGPAAARNCGIEAASARIIAFTDSDCVVDGGWLGALVAKLDSPGVGAVAGRRVNARAKNVVQKALQETHAYETKRIRDRWLQYADTANALYRREVFERVGGFDTKLRTGEDIDLSWRMQMEGGFALAEADESIVRHTDPTSLAQVFRQFYAYGRGHVHLYERYGEIVKREELGRVLGQYGRLALQAAAIPKVAVEAARRPDGEMYLTVHYVNLVRELGVRLGRLAGSIERGVVFL